MKLSHDNLLNRYLQAVGFWLPRVQKDDILAELSEDLQSQIDDREAELGRGLEETEVAAILRQRGRPMLVAGSFLPQQSLIGPVLYPIYILVLKIVALCYAVPWLLTWIGFAIFDQAQGRFHFALPPHGLGTLWTIVFTQFGAITLIFAVIDRVSTKSKLLGDWDPGKLPKVRLPEASKRRCNAIAGVIFGVFGFAWLLALPSHPFLLVGPAIFAVKAAPVWSTVYLAILVLAAAGIVENVVTLARPQLTWFLPLFRIATSILGLWIAYRLIQAHTYLVAMDARSSQYVAITNLIALICAICAAIGLGMGLCVYIWQAARAISRSAHPPATRLA
jgi:hypothetical protein